MRQPSGLTHAELGDEQCDGGRTGAHAELAQDRLDVPAHGLPREREVARDLVGAASLGEQTEHLALARGDAARVERPRSPAATRARAAAGASTPARAPTRPARRRARRARAGEGAPVRQCSRRRRARGPAAAPPAPGTRVNTRGTTCGHRAQGRKHRERRRRAGGRGRRARRVRPSAATPPTSDAGPVGSPVTAHDPSPTRPRRSWRPTAVVGGDDERR